MLGPGINGAMRDFGCASVFAVRAQDLETWFLITVVDLLPVLLIL
jgi:hypothetical protein